MKHDLMFLNRIKHISLRFGEGPLAKTILSVCSNKQNILQFYFISLKKNAASLAKGSNAKFCRRIKLSDMVIKVPELKPVPILFLHSAKKA